MLKIEVHEIPAEQRWVLVGKLVAPWSSELQASWDSGRSARKRKKRVVDLRDIVSIDEDGRRVLGQMLSDGAEFITGGLYSEYVIESLNLTRNNRSGARHDSVSDRKTASVEGGHGET